MIQGKVQKFNIDGQHITMEVSFSKNSEALETHTFKYNMVNFKTINELITRCKSDIEQHCQHIMLRFFGKSRNGESLNELASRAVGYTKKVSSMIIKMDDEEWEINEGGIMKVL